jgi:hypothetical protein
MPLKLLKRLCLAVSKALNRIVTVQECDARMLIKEQMLVTKMNNE